MGTHSALNIPLCLVAIAVATPIYGQPNAAPANNVRSPSDQTDRLLENARVFEMKNEVDRERSELLRILRSEPNHPRAIVMLGLLEARADNLPATIKLLARLKTAHPNDPGIAQLEEAVRIGGAERKKMSQIQLLARFGKNEEAAAAMRELFPSGPPGGDLALTYFRVIGNTKGGWQEALNGLEKLIKNEPDNTRLQLALAQHLTNRAETRAAGMASFASLVNHPNVDRQFVLDTWERALVVLERVPEHISMYLAYVEADPKNFSIRDALADARRVEADRRPWMLRDAADELLIAGRVDQAEALLKEALQLAPANPWVRFDLSRLYQKQGAKKQGRALMEQGLTAAPDLPDMTYAVALYLGLLDETEAALRLLNQIPSASRSPVIAGFVKKMEIQLQAEQALSLFMNGKRNDALAILESAEVAAGDDSELVSIVANAWFDVGDTTRGIARISHLISRQPSPTVVTRLRYAKLLNRAGKTEELAAILNALAATSSQTMSNLDKEDFRFLEGALAADIADKRRSTGDYSGARTALAPILAKYPDNADLAMAMARVEAASGDLKAAQAAYLRVLSQNPKNLGARLALARVSNEAGEKAAAIAELETILTNAATDDFEIRMSVADVFLEMKDLVRARSVIDQAAKSAPDRPRVLVQFGRLARAEGKLVEAVEYFKKANARDDIERIEAGRKLGLLHTGVDSLSKSGTPGVSKLNTIESPIEIRIPVGYAGQAVFHVDPVRINAGSLQLDDIDNLRRFGKILALSPAGILNAPVQSARGTAVAVGYEFNNLRMDIGTTPLGFPVSDIVGGIKSFHSQGAYSYSLEVSRRPITSSLLSYAGARDPVSGQVWGGVRRTGLNWATAYTVGPVEAFADVGFFWLTGRNVANNNQFALRTGVEWKIVQREGIRFSISLPFTHWRYHENLSNYTFGHGGYYSPQSYSSISLQPRWTGRTGRLTYLLNGSVSVSRSREKDMPYYPTDAALQSAGGSIYAGGPGRGRGYSIGTALEYQLASGMFIGGRFGIDRSAFYTPNFASLYLRYAFNRRRGNAPSEPDPVKPYSRF